MVINSDQVADDTPYQTKGTFYMTVLLSGEKKAIQENINKHVTGVINCSSPVSFLTVINQNRTDV